MQRRPGPYDCGRPPKGAGIGRDKRTSQRPCATAAGPGPGTRAPRPQPVKARAAREPAQRGRGARTQALGHWGQNHTARHLRTLRQGSRACGGYHRAVRREGARRSTRRLPASSPPPGRYTTPSLRSSEAQSRPTPGHARSPCAEREATSLPCRPKYRTVAPSCRSPRVGTLGKVTRAFTTRSSFYYILRSGKGFVAG